MLKWLVLYNAVNKGAIGYVKIYPLPSYIKIAWEYLHIKPSNIVDII